MNYSFRVFYALFAVLSTLLISCGGGGDSGGGSPPFISAQPVSVTVYESEAASFEVSAVSSSAVTYQWRKNGAAIAGATTSKITIASAVKTDSGAVYAVAISNPDGTTVSRDATLTVLSASPSVTTEPKPAVAAVGESTTFSVTPSGIGPFTYQWYRNNEPVSGATASSYTTTIQTGDDGAQYSVKITNNHGSATVVVSTVAVESAPTITTQPTATTVYQTQAATFSVTATALRSVSYQWKKNGTNIPGATSSSYTLGAASLSDQGSTFSVVVTGAGGSTESVGAKLTVKPAAPQVTVGPAATAVALGQTATFTVGVEGLAPFTYQWRRNAIVITGATESSFTTPFTTPNDDGALYSVVITNALGSVTSDSGTLTVWTPPVISAQPASVTVYETQAATFSVSTVGQAGKAPYQWRKTAFSSGIARGVGAPSYQWKRNGVDIAGATTSTYAINATKLADHGARISVAVTANGLTTLSDSATLTVKQASLTIISAPQSTTVTVSQTATFNVGVDGLPPYSYQWMRNGTNINGATASSYTTGANALANDGDRYSVQVSNSKGSITSASAVLTVGLAPLADLVISEVGACYYANFDCWFEIHNPTNASVNLAQYSAKTSSQRMALVNNVPTYSSVSSTVYTLPSVSVAAGGYVIVSGNVNTRPQIGTQLVRVGTGNLFPHWGSGSGHIELLKNGVTVDFVRFGTSTQAPSTGTAWSGGNVTAAVGGLANYGKSAVRPYPIRSTSYSAADWVAVDWVTPGGRNDVPAGATDLDADGIPDSAEVEGGTFAGLDVYAMGARAGVRNILIEVDRMNSTDAGINPQIDALSKVQASFAAKDITVLFDAGTSFSSSFSPADFNLGQGNNKVTYERCVTFDEVTCTLNSSNKRSIYDWKAEFMDLRRTPIFHYLLFGSTQQFDGKSGSSGRAEIAGNDLIITLGANNLNTSTTQNKNQLINYQSTTVMHELGHNLGLLHGGFENDNYKPNYLSVMNYLYQLNGLDPNAKSGTVAQRWLWDKGRFPAGRCGLTASPCGDPAQFVIDYSNGSSAALNEAALLESDNVGRGTDSDNDYADWNANGVKDTATFQLDLNLAYGPPYSFKSLRDYDDWSNLKLAFVRNQAGNNGVSPNRSIFNPIDPIANDRQPVADEQPPSPQFFEELRRLNAN